ncbi:MAG: hypothetical protein WCI30_10230 [Clostridia bacterium]
MSKTKKVVALLLTLVFLLSAIIPVGAAPTASEVTTSANGLAIYGILDTPGDTTTSLTRGQFAKIASLAGGKTAVDYRTAQVKASIYKDIKTVDWYNGWSQLAPFQGIDAAPNFAPKALIKRIEVLRIMVRLMNIVDVTDNAAFMAQARALGLTDAPDMDANAAVTRGEAFVIAAKAIDMNLGTRFFPGRAYILAPTALQVASITAINAKQVDVLFSKAVDKTAAETLANYDVFKASALTTDVLNTAGTGAVAVLQADGKTVRLTLDTASNFDNFSTTNKVVVKAGVGLTTTVTNANVAFRDTTIPTLLSAKATGSREITLIFSEPVKNTPTNVVVNDNTVGINLSGATYSVTGYSMKFSTNARMSIGTSYTVKISAGTTITDYAGYAVIPASASFVYGYSATAPTYVVKASNERTATIEFSSAIDQTTLLNNAAVLFSHTYSGANQVTGGAITNPTGDSRTFVITFANAFPPGSSTMYARYATGTLDANKVQDNFGNIVTLINLPISTVADFTAPTATVAMKAGSSTVIEVTYSEAVNDAIAKTYTNYTLKQGATVKDIATTITVDASNSNKYLLTSLNPLSGTYTLAIKNIKDVSFAENLMATTTYNLTVADLIRPTVVDIYGGTNQFYYVQAINTKVKIYFSEAMDMTSISTLANYQNAAGVNPIAALPATDGKSVVITYAATPSGIMTVGSVKDAAGNVLENFATSLFYSAIPDVALLTTTSAITSNLFADSTTTIKIYLNDLAAGFILADFEITTGGAFFNPDAIAVDNSSGKSLVTLTLAPTKAFTAAVTGVQVRTNLTTVSGANADGAKVSIPLTAVADKIAPTVHHIAFSSSTSISLVLTEALNASTAALTGLNNFSVSGGTLTQAVIAEATVITLTGTDFTIDTDVFYNGTNITDMNGNKLGAINWIATLSNIT